MLRATIALSLLAATAGTAAAEPTECQDENTLTSHPSSYKYLTRDKLQVWPLAEDDNLESVMRKLEVVRDAYHTIAPPKFMHDLLFPRNAVGSFESWIASQNKLREDYARLDWFFVPNPEYLGGYNPASPDNSGYNASVARWFHQADWWKCRDGGAVAIGWYAHRGLTRDDFTDPERFAAVTAKAGYKTQILDLTAADDLEWLKEIRTAAEQHATRVYGYSADANDRLSLYFHWPTGGATNTLHLHTRINYPMSPVEYNRSVMLDDLIAFFEEDGENTGIEFVARKMIRAGGLITNHIKNEHDDRALYAALRAGWGVPVEDDNPFKAIHKVIPFISGTAMTAEIQLIPADERPEAHSYVRFGEVKRADLFDENLEFVNPIDGRRARFLTEELLEALKLEDLQRDTVEEVLACIRPFFDGKTARHCLVWKANDLDI